MAFVVPFGHYEWFIMPFDLKIAPSKFQNIGVDPHFSRAPPLDRRDSLFICEKLIFRKSWSRHLFYFYFKGKIKQERKTLKCDSIIFGKSMSSESKSGDQVTYWEGTFKR